MLIPWIIFLQQLVNQRDLYRGVWTFLFDLIQKHVNSSNRPSGSVTSSNMAYDVSTEHIGYIPAADPLHVFAHIERLDYIFIFCSLFYVQK